MTTILIPGFCFRDQFDPKENIQTCAQLIHKQLEKKTEEGIRSLQAKRRLADELKDQKKLLKLMIRIAAESHDHWRTVDFISVKAKTQLESNIKEKEKDKDKKLNSNISHEHVVPCEVIYQKILGIHIGPKRPTEEDIQEILVTFSYRALVHSNERVNLDAEHKSRMPESWDSHSVLARYSAVGIDTNLLAINSRGTVLLDAWNARDIR